MNMISRWNMGIENVDIEIDGVKRFQAVKKQDFLGGWKLINSLGINCGQFESLIDIQNWIETLDK